MTTMHWGVGAKYGVKAGVRGDWHVGESSVDEPNPEWQYAPLVMHMEQNDAQRSALHYGPEAKFLLYAQMAMQEMGFQGASDIALATPVHTLAMAWAYYRQKTKPEKRAGELVLIEPKLMSRMKNVQSGRGLNIRPLTDAEKFSIQYPNGIAVRPRTQAEKDAQAANPIYDARGTDWADAPLAGSSFITPKTLGLGAVVLGLAGKFVFKWF